MKKIGIGLVTAAASPHSIGSVPAPTYVARRAVVALTKRRAVDFCRVAAAICPASQLTPAR
jgi:hypothetical protein